MKNVYVLFGFATILAIVLTVLVQFSFPTNSSRPQPQGGTTAVQSVQGALPLSCEITNAKKLSDGGDQDWSLSQDLIAYDKLDGNNTYQLHTMKSDGSGDTCLSCTHVAGAPLVARNKVEPSWDPTGQFIVVAAEMDDHPFAGWFQFGLFSELSINAVWNNLWAVTPDGSKWYRLTNYSNTITDGAMGVTFSPDGKKVLWSRIVQPADSTINYPWGKWQMYLADWVVTNGVPSLQNIQDITPPDSKFVEAEGFSPDGKTIVLSSDRDTTSQWAMDIWKMDLATGTLTNLTKSPDYDEHPMFTPSGQKIVYMSSKPLAGRSTFTFAAELMIMNPDGTDQQQISHLNFPGYPDSLAGSNMIMHIRFNTDATKMVATVQSGDHYPARQMWIYTFAGSCYGNKPISPTPIPTLTGIPTPTSVVPTITANPTQLPEDIDKDGCVGILDFNSWFQAVKGRPQPGTQPDINRDGSIDIVDFNLWFKAMKELPPDKLC